MEPNKVVLIVSTGAQDLKFWASSEFDGTVYVVSLPIGNCRAFHERLNAPEAARNFYRVVSFGEIESLLKIYHTNSRIQRIKTQPKKFMDWDKQNCKVKEEVYILANDLDLSGIMEKLAFRPLRDKNDRYLLAPAKIADTV